MVGANLSVDEVFGINRALPLNYVERNSADTILVNNLARRQHLVIYGSSKQGKTSLRKHCLKTEDYIVIHCSNKWSMGDLNEAILKQAGFELTLSNTLTTSGKHKIFAKIKATFFGAGAEGGGESEKSKEEAKTTAPLELDSLDVNDIIQALKQIHFSKFIVLEDFHYLPTETQKDFSVGLKAFHENSEFSFLIIGVWLEENRLTVYNGDLTGRLLPINADKWTKVELEQIISKGESLLNITFDSLFKTDLLNSCYDSVYIVQEACHLCCQKEGVFSKQETNLEIGQQVGCLEIIDRIVNQQTGRFNSFLTQFSEGFQDTALEMHKWLLYPILIATPENLEKGFRQAEIRGILQSVHPKGSELNSGNVTQSLQSVASLQIKKDIKPTILDYDQTNLRLNIVDKSFLIWLSRQNKNDLLELVGLPLI
jgi:acyl carrier protein